MLSIEHQLSDTQFLNELAEIIPANVHPEILREALVECAIWHELSIRGRPDKRTDEREARQQLDQLESCLDKVQAALNSLPPHASEILDRRSNFHLRCQRKVAEVGRSLQVYRQHLDDFAEIVKASRTILGQPPRGQPKSHAPAIVLDLAELWQIWTGKWPTMATNEATHEKYGPFRDFCARVVPLIYEAADERPRSLDNAIKEALYPSKKNATGQGA